MKIRKIHIKNYKMFKDVTIDFTDHGKTLDIIVIAGINGSGKTSLLQLLQKLFSERLNLFKIQTPLHKYEEENDALICDEVELELDISQNEKRDLISLAHKFEAKVIKFMKNPNRTAIKKLGRPLQNKQSYIKLLYKLGKTNAGDFIIHQNDFRLFGILPEDELQKIFKVLYFPSAHSEIKKPKSSNTILGILHDKSSVSDMESDGIVFPINIFSHRKTVETHIVELIQEQLITHRELTSKEVIEDAISKINQLLKGIDLKTILVDINSEQPIFESFSGIRILSNELSDGEKRLYYKAILFDKLRPQNSLILVDEPETSLHPTWQQEVLKLYNNIQGDNQVILATHSPHIIASVHPDHLFILNVNSDKKTVECFNAKGDKNFYTKGSEPNDILNEVMGTPLRNQDTRDRISRVFELLKSQPDKIDEPENWSLIDSLMSDLGRFDPVVMRIIHKLSVIRSGE